jgi:hypothetical protein
MPALEAHFALLTLTAVPMVLILNLVQNNMASLYLLGIALRLDLLRPRLLSFPAGLLHPPLHPLPSSLPHLRYFRIPPLPAPQRSRPFLPLLLTHFSLVVPVHRTLSVVLQFWVVLLLSWETFFNLTAGKDRSERCKHSASVFDNNER